MQGKITSRIEVTNRAAEGRFVRERWNFGWPLNIVFRCGKFHDMITTSTSGLVPEKLPPTDGAAKYHSLRVHLQVVIWKTLNTSILSPQRWGWKIEDNVFIPITTDLPIAPDSILKFVRCKCKKSSKNPCSTNRCSCKKYGLNCVAACGDCRGEYCTNVTVAVDMEDTDNIDDPEWVIVISWKTWKTAMSSHSVQLIFQP